MIDQIKSLKVLESSDDLKDILRDLEKSKSLAKPNEYRASGKHYMMSQARSKMQQRTAPLYSMMN